MKRIRPWAARLLALIPLMSVVLVSLGAFAPAAVALAAAAHARRGLAALGRHVHQPVSMRVLGIEDYILTVANLDRSVAFYHDVIGLPLLRTSGRPAGNALEQSLTDTPGARFRSAVFANPTGGPPLVLEEFTGTVRRTQRPRIVDPGAATVQVRVRDLTPVLSAAARGHIPFVTRGGRALPLDPYGTRGIVLRDPDGFYVRLAQPAATAAVSAVTGNVLGLGMQYTVAAPATIVHFYHDVLGLLVHANTFARDGSVGELFDAAGAQRALAQAEPFSSTAGDTAGAGSMLQFAAFRGVPRHTYSGRPQDIGTPAIALRVSDLTAALRAIHASGTLIVSAGGQPILTGRGGATILVRDPAGLLLQLIQEPAATPRGGR